MLLKSLALLPGFFFVLFLSAELPLNSAQGRNVAESSRDEHRKKETAASSLLKHLGQIAFSGCGDSGLPSRFFHSLCGVSGRDFPALGFKESPMSQNGERGEKSRQAEGESHKLPHSESEDQNENAGRED